MKKSVETVVADIYFIKFAAVFIYHISHFFFTMLYPIKHSGTLPYII